MHNNYSSTVSLDVTPTDGMITCKASDIGEMDHSNVGDLTKSNDYLFKVTLQIPLAKVYQFPQRGLTRN